MRLPRDTIVERWKSPPNPRTRRPDKTRRRNRPTEGRPTNANKRPPSHDTIHIPAVLHSVVRCTETLLRTRTGRRNSQSKDCQILHHVIMASKQRRRDKCQTTTTSQGCTIHSNRSHIIRTISHTQKDFGYLPTGNTIQQVMDMVVPLAVQNILTSFCSIQPQSHLDSRLGKGLGESMSVFHSTSIIHGNIDAP